LERLKWLLLRLQQRLLLLLLLLYHPSRFLGRGGWWVKHDDVNSAESYPTMTKPTEKDTGFYTKNVYCINSMGGMGSSPLAALATAAGSVGGDDDGDLR
jgi:hypothetical protein